MVVLPDDSVCFRIVLSMPSGPALRRSWTWRQVARGEYPRWPFEGEPHWLLEPTSVWRDPLGPHEFNAQVPEGMEDFAHQMIGL